MSASALGSFLPDRADLRELLALALPVVVVQVGLMLMGVVDSIMVGRVSAAALAGVAIGNVYFFAVAVFGMGIVMALDPVVAQAVGAHDEPAIARAVQRGVLISLGLTLPCSLPLFFGGPVLTALAQPADAVSVAHGYLVRLVPSMFPFFGFIVFRQTLQAMGRMAPIVWLTVLANLLNAFLDWVLVYGKFGFPVLGANGAAWATTIARWAMMLGLLAAAWRDLHGHLKRWHPEVFELAPLRRMLAIGAPIGAHMQLEFGVFGAVGLLMGRLGTPALAAHEIALNLASLTFMVPLGVAAAGTVLVGRAVGQGAPERVGRAVRASMVVGVAFMCGTALTFLTVPEWFARIYSRDVGVVAVAATLIPLAGVFQVFDGIQAISAGLLRGLADTRYPMIVGLIGFWLVGLPVSLLLAFPLGWGPRGLWWGLVAGLVAVSFLLLRRVRHRLRREMVRVVIDHAPAA
ncbi:MAG TPA: MATE family efflux transporter [Gemmatimonadales bacterium]|jgi:MATE family multidrug resistance protein|nr:MATE family efflux transporter [Gemmatimonadales bacterium]